MEEKANRADARKQKTQVWHHRGNCRIVRSVSSRGNHLALLIGENQELVRSFPFDWEDEQIWDALDFANFAWRQGRAQEQGIRELAQEGCAESMEAVPEVV